MDMERIVLTNLARDRFGIKTIEQRRISFRTVIKKKTITKLFRTKINRTNGYLELRQVQYAHCEPRKLAMFDATCFEFGTCQVICRNFSATQKKSAQHVLRFPDLHFSSTRLAELLL